MTSEDPNRATPQPTPEASGSSEPHAIKLLIDLGPLLVFAVTYWLYDLKTATAVLVVTTLMSLIAARILLGKISTSLAVTAVIVAVFGTMTLALDDPRFIKMKPTVVNLIFAGVLSFGLVTNRHFLKLLLGEAIRLDDDGWRKLTQRWIGLFLVLGAMNEVVWRTMSEPAWVNFKVFGILPITLVFAAFQIPLMQRHAAKD